LDIEKHSIFFIFAVGCLLVFSVSARLTPFIFKFLTFITFMRTSLFLGMTGFAFLTTFGLQGCSDDDGGNGGKIPPPRLMLRWVM
jgi:hypothetical protein